MAAPSRVAGEKLVDGEAVRVVAQVVPFCSLHVVRRARNQHVVFLAVQALGQRDHRVHVTTGAEWSEQNFHARSLRRTPAPRPPQSVRRYE
jgi:hypothetical protein